MVRVILGTVFKVILSALMRNLYFNVSPLQILEGYFNLGVYFLYILYSRVEISHKKLFPLPTFV